MSLSPENKALIERVMALRNNLGAGIAERFPETLNDLLDAARQEGARGGEPVAWAYEYTNHLVGDRAPGGWLRAVAFNPPTRARIEGGFARDVRALVYASPAEPSVWRPIESAPRDGAYILARVAPRDGDDRWGHLAGRCFVIRHEGCTPSGYDLGWSVFPGFGGTSDSWFEGWLPLPPTSEGGGA